MAEQLAPWQKKLLQDYPGLFDVAGHYPGENSLVSLLVAEGMRIEEAEQIAHLAVRKVQAEEFKTKHPLMGGWRKKK